MTRQRQANGAHHRIGLSVTREQLSRWRDDAASDHVTLPRWIVERVENKPPTMLRRAIRSEITGIRAEIRGYAANLNQLAHRAHIDGVDLQGWDDTVTAVEKQQDLLNRLTELLS